MKGKVVLRFERLIQIKYTCGLCLDPDKTTCKNTSVGQSEKWEGFDLT